MANTILYPFGVAAEAPTGVILNELVEVQNTLYSLADWAFKGGTNYLNSAFRSVLFFPTSTSGVCGLRIGTADGTDEYFETPIYYIGNSSTYDLTFSAGIVDSSSNRYPSLCFFNENYEYGSYWGQTAAPRTVTGSTETWKYVRMSFPASKLLDAYLIDNITGRVLFDGSTISADAIKTKERFLESEYIPSSWKPNSRGDFIGWSFGTTDTPSTSQRNDITRPYFRRVGINATDLPFSIGKVVQLPSNQTLSIEFSVGGVDSDMMLRLLNPSTGTASYYSANANPRTVSINSATWTHLQLYFRTENYANCYIKDVTNNVMLWEGAASPA
ncbi:MAG: hypothetical protein IJP49_06170 [Bacteroidales bacterium]|nr:hypothetical protein [Bacteroidales bacterium]